MKTKNESEDSSKKRTHDSSKSGKVEKIESSKIKENKTESPGRRSSHGNQRRRDSNESSCKINSKNMTDKVEDESPAKPSMSSQVQIFTDFKRK